MSAKASPTADTTDAPERDTEPAIVAEFRERLLNRHPECDDVNAALRIEEQRPSTTQITDELLCEVCGSRQLARKDGPDMSYKTDTSYVCRWCGSHADNAVEQTDLEAWQ